MAPFTFTNDLGPCDFKGPKSNRHLIANDRFEVHRVVKLAGVQVRLDQTHRVFKELFSIHSNHLLVCPIHLGMAGSGVRATAGRNRNFTKLADSPAPYRTGGAR